MKFVKRYRRFFSALFLLITLESVVRPVAAYASYAGGDPHQPEYTSYEKPGATDMVNLMTGDFTYSIPLLDVPGPEGNFSIPLTYNAGIGNDQESSWAGLGWTLNVGAITRQINQYPDDAGGEVQEVSVQNLNGIKGWYASIPGGSQIGWNNIQGHSGVVSLFGLLNFSYDEHHFISGFNALGLKPHGGTVDVDQEQLTTGLGTIFSSMDPTGEAQASFNKGLALGIATSMVGSISAPSTQSYSDAGRGYWTDNMHMEKKGTLGLYTNYWAWLDQTRRENMFGVMDLGATYSETQPVDNYAIKAQINGGTPQPVNRFKLDATDVIGAASDVNYNISPSADFTYTVNPATLAMDNYLVKALGITGSITPYRLEVGSVSVAREMTSDHIRLQIVPYLNNYKVPFVYEGAYNSYLHHTGTESTAFDYGLSASFNSNEIDLALNDDIFGSARVKSDFTNVAEPKIAQANHIEWVSLGDVMNSVTVTYSGVNTETYSWTDANKGAQFSNKFMDYFSDPAARYKFRFNNSIQNADNGPTQASFSSIGGFVITGVDGVNYHFAIPVYDYNYQVEIRNSDNTSNSTISRRQGSANTWLLTGITGPDFVDRNNNGTMDESDWGYWVKFNYYQYGDEDWSVPQRTAYLPDAVNANTYTRLSGTRQQYYLNSVETRSHVALFIKDQGNSRGVSETTPVRLMEIALLKRSDYNTLVSTYNLPVHAGTVTSKCFSDQFYSDSDLSNPVSPKPSGTFIIQNAARRIRFNHSYDLRSTNSAVASQGSRTLKRISIYGRNGMLIVPDYKFDYSLNPNYDFNKWDAWGMYNSSGAADNTSHRASGNDSDGAAWSLTQITTPQGSNINVNYERDKYASVSGMQVSESTKVQFSAQKVDLPYQGVNSITVNDVSKLKPGNQIQISGTTSFICPSSNQSISNSFSVTSTIASITGNTVTLNDYVGGYSNCGTGTSSTITYSGTLQQAFLPGGGIRVGSITLNDNSVTYKTRYLYTNTDGSCSGVLAQEPPFAKTINYDFSSLPSYPNTPVMYSTVSVLSGRLSNDTDFNTRTVYQFETPDLSMFSHVADYPFNFPHVPKYDLIPGAAPGGFGYLPVRHEISDYSSRLGAIKSVNVYDVSNSATPVSTTTFGYTSQILNSGGAYNNQGLFSTGTIMHDYFPFYAKIRMTRTTSIKYPYTLQKVVSTKDGFTTETDNLAWDFISGQVVEKNTTSPLGLKTKTVTVPAYTRAEYAQMGPKALDVANNKNMLTQVAAEYVYKLDALNNNITGLISGGATTWNNNWTYRDYDGVSSFTEGAGTPASNVWRKNKTYVYKGSIGDRQADGSLANYSTFDFSSSAANTGWQQTGEVTRYDHYSLPVESKNSISGIYSSTKTDFNNKFIFASASNANYYEFAYSGAEDDNSTGFFGGEVARGNGTVVSGIPGIDSHTGQSAAQVTSGNNSFVYQPANLAANRTYRAQVWTNSLNGAIYYKVNGGSAVNTAPLSVNKAGNWYKILVDVTIPSTFVSFEVGVTSTSGTVSFDDFKFQPRDGAVTANVYDASTGYLTYTIDNNNMYTRYQYDNRGIVMKTFIESIKYNGERLVTERKDDYKRNHTDQ